MSQSLAAIVIYRDVRPMKAVESYNEVSILLLLSTELQVAFSVERK